MNQPRPQSATRLADLAVPSVANVRDQLSRNRSEAKFLRRLLRLALDAERAGVAKYEIGVTSC